MTRKVYCTIPLKYVNVLHTCVIEFGSSVSVGVRLDGVGIDGFVEDDFLSLGLFDRLGACVLFDHVWIVYGDDMWFFQRFGDFVDDVGLVRRSKFNWACPRVLRVNSRTLRSTFPSWVLQP